MCEREGGRERESRAKESEDCERALKRSKKELLHRRKKGRRRTERANLYHSIWKATKSRDRLVTKM